MMYTIFTQKTNAIMFWESFHQFFCQDNMYVKEIACPTLILLWLALLYVADKVAPVVHVSLIRILGTKSVVYDLLFVISSLFMF